MLLCDCSSFSNVCTSQDKDESNDIDGSLGELDSSKAKKEDKDDKGKKKKLKRYKVHSDFSEPVVMEDPGETQGCTGIPEK